MQEENEREWNDEIRFFILIYSILFYITTRDLVCVDVLTGSLFVFQAAI